MKGVNERGNVSVSLVSLDGVRKKRDSSTGYYYTKMSCFIISLTISILRNEVSLDIWVLKVKSPPRLNLFTDLLLKVSLKSPSLVIKTKMYLVLYPEEGILN